MSLISLFGDGYFYYAEQPVQIVAITADGVRMHVRRYARLNMIGTISRELQCQQLYIFPIRHSPLEKGWGEFDITYPLPESAKGECLYRCNFSYQPFGIFGPTLTYTWESESFLAPESK